VIIAVVGQGAPRDLDRIVDDPSTNTEPAPQLEQEQPAPEPTVVEQPVVNEETAPEEIDVPFPSDAPESLV